MQHVQAFIHSAAEAFELQGPVYEFGYCAGCGSAEVDMLRECLPTAGNVASDWHEQIEVDRLEDLTRLPFPDSTARTVICINTLEHVFEPRRAIAEMIRILAPGGMLLVCSPTAPQIADQPDHYWRPTPGAIQRLLGELEATLIGWQGADQFPHTVFGMGCKGPVAGRFLPAANRFLDCFQNRLSEAAASVDWWQRFKRLVATWACSKDQRRAVRDYHKAHFILHLPVDQQLKHQLLESCLPEERTGTPLDLSQ